MVWWAATTAARKPLRLHASCRCTMHVLTDVHTVLGTSCAGSTSTWQHTLLGPYLLVNSIDPLGATQAPNCQAHTPHTRKTLHTSTPRHSNTLTRIHTCQQTSLLPSMLVHTCIVEFVSTFAWGKHNTHRHMSGTAHPATCLTIPPGYQLGPCTAAAPPQLQHHQQTQLSMQLWAHACSSTPPPACV